MASQHPEYAEIRPATPGQLLAEAQAGDITSYSVYATDYLPGALQTPGYARAILADAYPEQELDELVHQRQRYGRLVVGSAAVQATIIIGEPALDRLYGGALVTLGALHQVNDVILKPRPNTSVHVLPYDSGILPPAPYIIRQMRYAAKPEVLLADGDIRLDPGGSYAGRIIEAHRRLIAASVTGPDAYALVARRAIALTNSFRQDGRE